MLKTVFFHVFSPVLESSSTIRHVEVVTIELRVDDHPFHHKFPNCRHLCLRWCPTAKGKVRWAGPFSLPKSFQSSSLRASLSDVAPSPTTNSRRGKWVWKFQWPTIKRPTWDVAPPPRKSHVSWLSMLLPGSTPREIDFHSPRPSKNEWTGPRKRYEPVVAPPNLGIDGPRTGGRVTTNGTFLWDKGLEWCDKATRLRRGDREQSKSHLLCPTVLEARTLDSDSFRLSLGETNHCSHYMPSLLIFRMNIYGWLQTHQLLNWIARSHKPHMLNSNSALMDSNLLLERPHSLHSSLA